MIPFTKTEFLRVFEQYNDAVWPWHVLIYLAGLTAFALAFTRRTITSKLISLILASLWLWMGVVYHLLFFTTINKAARLFGALFIIQSLVFIFAGVLSSRLSFRFRFDVQGLIGGALITYAVVAYPIIGILLGHHYPAAPTFGVPCPTTIFTFGLLIGAGVNIRFYMLVIPMLWSLVGFWAAISLGMYEDLGLVIAGLSTIFILQEQRRTRVLRDQCNVLCRIGFSLVGAKRISFYTKGEKGGEIVEFISGGIVDESKPYKDYFRKSTGEVLLTTTWTKYVIDLSDLTEKRSLALLARLHG